jgi:hypothetical protein
VAFLFFQGNKIITYITNIKEIKMNCLKNVKEMTKKEQCQIMEMAFQIFLDETQTQKENDTGAIKTSFLQELSSQIFYFKKKYCMKK